MKTILSGYLSRLLVFGLVSALFSCAGLGGAKKSEAPASSKGYYAAEKDSSRGASNRKMKSRAIPSADKKNALGLASVDDEISADGAVEQEPKKKSAERMIIYRADYTIEVDAVDRTIRDVNSIIAKFDGFIESSATSDSFRAATVIIRVPVKNFESALKEIEKLGEVKEKEVGASDVTMEFNDASLRVETAKKVRDRMYELLKRTVDVEERVQILREIERLNLIIDSLTDKMAYLKNRASFSTITLNIKAKVREVVSGFVVSPFPWIAALNYENRTIFDTAGISFRDPDGFFNNRKEFFDAKCNCWLFTSPGEKSGVRIGAVKNYPPADIQFWGEAFGIDAENRKFNIHSRSEIKSDSGLAFKKYVFRVDRDMYYTVAFAVAGDFLIVIESRSINPDEFKSSEPKIDSFIKSVRYK